MTVRNVSNGSIERQAYALGIGRCRWKAVAPSIRSRKPMTPDRARDRAWNGSQRIGAGAGGPGAAVALEEAPPHGFSALNFYKRRFLGLSVRRQPSKRHTWVGALMLRGHNELFESSWTLTMAAPTAISSIVECCIRPSPAVAADFRIF